MDADEEQLEALQKWWKENGRTIIAGVVIGLGGVFGWNYYRAQSEREAEQASRVYEQMVDMAAADDHLEALARADLLMREHAESGYATLAGLLAAKSAMAAGQRDAAERSLRWVVDNGDRAELKDVARLRLARLLIDADDLGASLALLDQVSAGEFSGSVRELRGDAYRAQGRADAARDAYAAALASDALDPETRARVQMKLDDLGRTDFVGTSQ
ncbi:MAG: tetratricopeptide repeat protein [Gammaproteobacteria bacterium]|nr:tetratricopeptide repeat protein [Gammaproteobacteria bacterium]